MKKIFYLSLLILSTQIIIAQNSRNNAQYSFFADFKANRLGDAVTIIVVESSQASNLAETTVGRSSDLGLNFEGEVSDNQLPNANIGLGTDNNFSGTGTTKAQGVVKTRLSAIIDSVYGNGNLRIKGSRKITINGEEQTIIIRGIVRISDIQADNSVLSYNISDAEIIFEGSGMINDAQEPGWITKFFHWLF